MRQRSVASRNLKHLGVAVPEHIRDRTKTVIDTLNAARKAAGKSSASVSRLFTATMSRRSLRELDEDLDALDEIEGLERALQRQASFEVLKIVRGKKPHEIRQIARAAEHKLSGEE